MNIPVTTSIQLFYVLLMTYCVPRVTPGMITSSIRIEELSAAEDELLQIVTSSAVYTQSQRGFAESRRRLKDRFSNSDLWWSHPNQVYFLVKAFVTQWNTAIDDSPELLSVMTDQQATPPSDEDLVGARAAILRLQRVYKLPVKDMYAGDYLGYLGPPLAPQDAHEMGSRAFTDGMLPESEQWLTHAWRQMNANATVPASPAATATTTAGELPEVTLPTPELPLEVHSVRLQAAVVALLGRVHVYQGHHTTAHMLYEKSIDLDIHNRDVTQLGTDLATLRGKQNVVEKDYIRDEMIRLCSQPRTRTVDSVKAYHVCRYKPSLFLPYLRYKEEILAVKPYVSLFHQIVHESEIENITSFCRSKLSRATIEGVQISARRTSDVCWIPDEGDVTTRRLSSRISDMTWLDVRLREPDGPSSAEQLQVVNYGLGGHYSPHFDIIKDAGMKHLEESGSRISTFLIYMTDVDIGGHTVFVNADISVAPVKGMALFWHNVDTTVEKEDLTLHAGCPVLKGQKWIANKWIWTYGNMYRRPCPASSDATHLDVERVACSRRHDTPP